MIPLLSTLLKITNTLVYLLIFFFFFFFFFFLLGTQPYKETCGDKHKTRHRGCRDDVPMYREQLDRPGVSALALQPGIEKERRERYTVSRLTPRLSLCSNGCPCTEFGSATPRSGSSWCGAVSMGKPAVSSRTYSHHQLAAPPGTRFPGASLSPRHSQKPADLAWPFRQPWPGTLSQGV